MVVPCTKIKIEDPETGHRCAPNGIGEICIKSPFLMQRYLKRPKETEEFLDFEGFGHTGDMGLYNEDGNIIYVDRLKELIKYKNNHISPTEIEDILQRHEDVQECLVFGKVDHRVQELVTAVVVKHASSNVRTLKKL
jgi:4-coumarate--CoA ligase